jgi:hypothetical protein
VRFVLVASHMRRSQRRFRVGSIQDTDRVPRRAGSRCTPGRTGRPGRVQGSAC